MVKRERSRNVYQLLVSEEAIMTLLGGWRHHQCIHLPVLTEAAYASGGKTVSIPDDYTIERVFYDELYRSFVLIVAHPSFPEVPLGEYPQVLSLMNHAIVNLPVKSERDRWTVEGRESARLADILDHASKYTYEATAEPLVNPEPLKVDPVIVAAVRESLDAVGDIPACECADWGMTGCLDTCPRAVFIRQKRLSPVAR